MKKSIIKKFMAQIEHSTINDPEDESILSWSKLRSSNKIRKDTGLFQVEGIRAVEWFLKYVELEVINLVISSDEVNRRTPDMQHRTAEVLTSAIAKNIPIIDVNREVFRKLSDVNKPRGLMIIVKNNISTIESLINRVKENNGIAIVTVGINDPGNMGTIIRSGIAFRSTALFALAGSVDPYSPKVLRASTGHFLPSIRHESWQEFRRHCSQNNIKIIALDSSESYDNNKVTTSSNPDELSEFTGQPIVLCIGSEGKGFPGHIKKDFDLVYQIPMAQEAESLNAGVAASIALWYLRR